ncbi:MAG: hypothetical protein AAFS07_00960 [Pseudomonadota bacterium]
MIVCRSKRTAFVHIPKTGGSSLRRQIVDFDDNDRAFSKLARDPKLGSVERGHLRLGTLAEHYPEVFENLAACECFAATRDPHARFRSAVSEVLKKFDDRQQMAEMRTPELRRRVEAIIDGLRREPPTEAPRKAHFLRQIDFVYLRGRQIVQHLYPIEALPQMIRAIGDRLGVPLVTDAHDNRTVAMPVASLRAPLKRAGLAARALLPAGAFAKVKKAALAVLARDRSEREAEVFGSRLVRDFVDEFYADDAVLYATARARIIKGAA